MRKRTLKLYVWEQIFGGYHPGMAVALAHSAEEARAIMIDDPNRTAELYQDHLARKPKVVYLTSNTKPIAFLCHGGD